MTDHPSTHKLCSVVSLTHSDDGGLIAIHPSTQQLCSVNVCVCVCERVCVCVCVCVCMCVHAFLSLTYSADGG